jgi:hypothetical protein
MLFGPLAAALAALVLSAGPALADSPHFLYANNSVGSNGALTTSFKEAGLGTGTTSVAITLKADASALYQCFNNGGNHPKAGNKETVSSALQTSGNFPVSHGQTTAELSVGPPGPGDFSCPSGQTLFLQSVTYSNTNVSDASGTTFHATPDPISSGALHTPA